MISQLIDYLINLPTISGSPLGLALNSSDLKTEISNPAKTINLIDTRDTEMAPPYVRLWDTGETELLADFLAGASRAYLEKLFMHVECAAYGPTVSIASARAEYLRLAVEGKLQTLIGGVQSAGLPARTDLVGTNSTDVIKRIKIVGGRPTLPPMGPGTDPDAPQWTVSRVLRVEVWVGRSRAAA